MKAKLTLTKQREFFKLAGFMLLSRFQVYWGYPCTRIRGHARENDKILFGQLSYLGYSDAKGEMRLILLELRKNI
jgi:hypothetical protein